MSTKLSLENAPHDLSISATGCIMRTVILTLVPAFFACMYFYGWGIFITLLICLTSCLTTEGIILKLRNHNINRLWRDSSAMVTAVLLSFTLPPLLPWYLSVIGCIFAIAIVKHTFGGLGQNIFNPAMGGFIFLFFFENYFLSLFIVSKYLILCSTKFLDAVLRYKFLDFK